MLVMRANPGGIGKALVAAARKLRSFSMIYNQADYLYSISRDLAERAQKMQEDVRDIQEIADGYDQILHVLEGSTARFAPAIRQQANACKKTLEVLRRKVKELNDLAKALNDLALGDADAKRYSISFVLKLYTDNFKALRRDLPRYLEDAGLREDAAAVRSLNRPPG
jgi:methyl-accepting chemotaxis protein